MLVIHWNPYFSNIPLTFFERQIFKCSFTGVGATAWCSRVGLQRCSLTVTSRLCCKKKKVVPSSSIPLPPHCLLCYVYKSVFAAVQRIRLGNGSRLRWICCCLVSFNLDLLPDPTDYITAWMFCQQRAKVKHSVEVGINGWIWEWVRLRFFHGKTG